MRLVYFGSGEFGLPTFQRLADDHDVALVVTQPDRPAGRGRALSPTPLATAAAARHLSIVRPHDVNDATLVREIQSVGADAFVVIAFGQKLSRDLLRDSFAINLHASLVPKFRGAAPIHWAMINNEPETGVSVIALADRMDAGEIYVQHATPIDPAETAGELHDRLAQLGPVAISETLAAYQAGTLTPRPQNERAATRAPKLAKTDGTVRFDQSPAAVRARVHGLTPWPGCNVQLGSAADQTPQRAMLRLHRVKDIADGGMDALPGTLRDDLAVQCLGGAVQILEVQPPGSTLMSFEAYCRGHDVRPGRVMRERVEAIE